MITQATRLTINDMLLIGFGLSIGWLAVAGWWRGAPT